MSDAVACSAGVGGVLAESIVDFFQTPANQELIERLRAAGLTIATDHGDDERREVISAG